MLASNIGILLPLLLMAANWPDREKWVACGNGPAQYWQNMRTSSQRPYILAIQVFYNHAHIDRA